MSLTDPRTIERNRAEFHGESHPLDAWTAILCLLAPWAMIGFISWALWPKKPAQSHPVEMTFHP